MTTSEFETFAERMLKLGATTVKFTGESEAYEVTFSMRYPAGLASGLALSQPFAAANENPPKPLTEEEQRAAEEAEYIP